jgi:hypothetical protein
VANILRANCVVKQNAKYRCIYLYFQVTCTHIHILYKKPIHSLTVIITVRQREIDKKFLGMNEEKKNFQTDAKAGENCTRSQIELRADDRITECKNLKSNE